MQYPPEHHHSSSSAPPRSYLPAMTAPYPADPAGSSAPLLVKRTVKITVEVAPCSPATAAGQDSNKTRTSCYSSTPASAPLPPQPEEPARDRDYAITTPGQQQQQQGAAGYSFQQQTPRYNPTELLQRGYPFGGVHYEDFELYPPPSPPAGKGMSRFLFFVSPCEKMIRIGSLMWRWGIGRTDGA
jgi:hypothetical protein